MKKVRSLPSSEFLNECLSYDADTGVLKWKERPRHHFVSEVAARIWNKRNPGTIAGNKSIKPNGSRGRIHIGIKGTTAAHKIIWKMVYGVDPPSIIDHVNGDPWDNRLRNLRLATVSQNNSNKGPQKNNTSGIKGVSLNKLTGKWQASVGVGGKLIHVGFFPTKGLAAVANAKASLMFHGKFSLYYRSAT